MAIQNHGAAYDNFVLADFLETTLLTKLDFNRFVTLDTSLEGVAGMVKKIHRYEVTGELDTVAVGQGNTHDFESAYKEIEYRIQTKQGRTRIFDETVMTDPLILQESLKGLAESFVNDLTTSAIDEMKKTTNVLYQATCTYDNIVDCLTLLHEAPLVGANGESEEGVFGLISFADLAKFRKNLGALLVPNNDIIHTGSIGSVAGVPFFATRALKEGEGFVGFKDAVTAFLKKGVEMEQERDADVRRTDYYARKYALVALTDATKMVKISKVADPRVGYNLVTAAVEPADWASKWNVDYFKYVPEEDMMVVNDDPEYKANTVYHA